jgi:hypothetical protein
VSAGEVSNCGPTCAKSALAMGRCAARHRQRPRGRDEKSPRVPIGRRAPLLHESVARSAQDGTIRTGRSAGVTCRRTP